MSVRVSMLGLAGFIFASAVASPADANPNHRNNGGNRNQGGQNGGRGGVTQRNAPSAPTYRNAPSYRYGGSVRYGGAYYRGGGNRGGYYRGYGYRGYPRYSYYGYYRPYPRYYAWGPSYYYSGAPAYYYDSPPPAYGYNGGAYAGGGYAGGGYAGGGYAGAPGVRAVAEPQYSWGIGIRASQIRLTSDQPYSNGLALLARFNLGAVELEGELGQEYYNAERVDTKAGLSLYVPLSRGRVQPYLVVGAGVSFIDTIDADVKQAYLAAGGGLQFKFGRMSLGVDLRYNARRLLDDQNFTIQFGNLVNDHETAFEGRVTGLFYF